MRALGLYESSIDGIAGPLTRGAVRTYQRRRGLQVDGIAGPRTRRALGRRGGPRLGSRAMHNGMRGWDVAALQFLLASRGYGPGGYDGGFGPNTLSAVRRYQSAAGLAVDGVAGPATLRALRHRRASTRRRATPCGSFGPSARRSPTGSGGSVDGATPDSTSRLPMAGGWVPRAVDAWSSPAGTRAATATSSSSSTGWASSRGTPTCRASPRHRDSGLSAGRRSAISARRGARPGHICTSRCAGSAPRSTRGRDCSPQRRRAEGRSSLFAGSRVARTRTPGGPRTPIRRSLASAAVRKPTARSRRCPPTCAA